jgi:hypothetical protein
VLPPTDFKSVASADSAIAPAGLYFTAIAVFVTQFEWKIKNRLSVRQNIYVLGLGEQRAHVRPALWAR